MQRKLGEVVRKLAAGIRQAAAQQLPAISR